MIIRNLTIDDYPAVQEIHQQGIDTGVAAFDYKAHEWEKWDSKYLSICRLVSIKDNIVTGWAAITKFSDKPPYSGVCELSIYIHKNYRGQGIGEALLRALIIETEKNNIWTLQALIMKDNQQSIKLHEKCGFRVVGFYEKAGKYNGKWHDVIIMERRSIVAGID